jgi:hypothetical protein
VVTLNPRQFLDQVELPELSAADLQQVVNRGRTAPQVRESAPQSRDSGPDAAKNERLVRAGDEPRDPAAGESRAGRLDGMLARMDSNGDGVIDSGEWPSAIPVRFAEVDGNGDGKLDRGELTAALAKLPKRDGPPPSAMPVARGAEPVAGAGQ